MEDRITIKKIDSKRKFDFSTLTIFLLTIALGIGLTLTSNTFFSYSNIFSILYGVSITFFAAIGFTFLMIMGELDLSVGSVYAFSGMMVGMLMKSGVPLAFALMVSIAICIGFGLLNGFLVVRFKVASMMITLGTMTAVRGLANQLCSNLYGYTYASDYAALSKVKVGPAENGVYLTVILMIVIAVVLELMLRRTAIFKKMYFVGENIETARIYGMKAGLIKMVVFALSAALAGLGGIFAGSRIGFADVTLGEGLEFTILTAVVLGGASLSGGKGSVLRACVGLIFLAMISNGMIIHNIDPLIQQLIVGIILIIAVFVDTRMMLVGNNPKDAHKARLQEVANENK